jgi:hypothetical protein
LSQTAQTQSNPGRKSKVAILCSGSPSTANPQCDTINYSIYLMEEISVRYQFY